MKALRSFTVRPALPPELAALESLAMNLRWSWDEQTRDLFRWVDPEQWDASIHDPVRLLGLVSPARFDELAAEHKRLALNLMEGIARSLAIRLRYTNSELRLLQAA